jgi:predicted ATPase
MLKECESVELFIQRARAVSPTLSLDEYAPSIASICIHLDGLPLALELEAARTRIYAPQALLVRLSSRLDALVDGPRDLPARQKTLRDTLAWSYDLLESDEKTMFSRLGVFVGGCTLESARAVCGDGLTMEVASALESLLNKSLLRQETGQTGEMRFMMLETMREYAVGKLEQSGEIEHSRRRHAQYYMGITEHARSEIYGTNGLSWLACFDAEHENVRTAACWSLETDLTGEAGLHLIANIARFWESRGYWSEGRRWLETALASEYAKARTNTRARALHGLANITYLQSDYRVSRSLFEETIAIYRELGDVISLAHVAIGLGEVETEVGDYQTAMKRFHESYAVMCEHNNRRGMARALMQLGWRAMRLGDYEQAHEWLE